MPLSRPEQNKDVKNYKLPPELFGFSGMPLLLIEVEWDVLHSKINVTQYYVLNQLVWSARRTNSLPVLILLLREVDAVTAAAVCKFIKAEKTRGGRVRFIGRQAEHVLCLFSYITNSLLVQPGVTASNAVAIRVSQPVQAHSAL